ncbi:unnamed protein product [Ilex paraguariensis]|uniref:Uncharacterized protein n=1 Tax=Ilex paraguariensis TaxID=185542 RepID=A0ABC8TIF1_9AQUA
MFSGFPSLERLILKGCVNLVEVHESIGSLGKLVLLNMKDCRSLEKLPTNIGMLSSLETLNISGCSNLEEVPLELKEIKSLKTFQANEIDLSLLPSTTEENRQWHPLMWFGRSRKRTRPQLSKFFSTALPHSLVTLSLAGCNLSDGDFPKDFSSLTSLEVIDLSRNPICNLPDCIKGLDSLSEFYVFSCTSLQTLVGLPHIKRLLSADGCTSLEKITHASSSASMTHFEVEHCVNLVEVQGHLLLQPILNTDTEIIDNFELSNIEFIGNIEAFLFSMSAVKGKALPTQDGISSVFVPVGNALGCSSNSRAWSSAFVSVPSVQNRRIHGLNMRCVYEISEEGVMFDELLIKIEVDNGFKNMLTYEPAWFGLPESDEYIMRLSRWKLNGCKPGNKLNLQISMKCLVIKEFEVNLIYDEHEEKNYQSNSEDMFESTSTFKDTTFVKLGDGDDCWTTNNGLVIRVINSSSDDQADTEEDD